MGDRQEAQEAIEHISATLDGTKQSVDAILAFLQKPEKTSLKVARIIGNGITGLGILSAIDIIRTWIMGG